VCSSDLKEFSLEVGDLLSPLPPSPPVQNKNPSSPTFRSKIVSSSPASSQNKSNSEQTLTKRSKNKKASKKLSEKTYPPTSSSSSGSHLHSSSSSSKRSSSSSFFRSKICKIYTLILLAIIILIIGIMIKVHPNKGEEEKQEKIVEEEKEEEDISKKKLNEEEKKKEEEKRLLRIKREGEYKALLDLIVSQQVMPSLHYIRTFLTNLSSLEYSRNKSAPEVDLEDKIIQIFIVYAEGHERIKYLVENNVICGVMKRLTDRQKLDYKEYFSSYIDVVTLFEKISNDGVRNVPYTKMNIPYVKNKYYENFEQCNIFGELNELFKLFLSSDDYIIYEYSEALNIAAITIAQILQNQNFSFEEYGDVLSHLYLLIHFDKNLKVNDGTRLKKIWEACRISTPDIKTKAIKAWDMFKNKKQLKKMFEIKN
jgi:hypothetical protein